MKIFDILGPVMIGPSSSHTAGACRIGKMAKTISGQKFNKVTFYLHGSFGETYKGHGTDRALLAGVLGCAPDDERIREAFTLAEEKGMKYEFIKMDLGNVHPNTVKILFEYEDGHDFYITGSSIGGGNILIIDINGTGVNFTGDYPTIILRYTEQKGVIAWLSTLLADNGYNIESMKTIKNGEMVSLIVEIESDLDEKLKKVIDANKRFIFTKYIASK